MFKRFINRIMGENTDLQERIFRVILYVGSVVVAISAIVTFMEDLSPFAAIITASGLIFFILVAVVYFRFHLLNPAKLLLCYTLNLLVIPAAFFTCGGIDSGMPLYMLAGLFIIIPLLDGKARWICFTVSLIADSCLIGFSYNFMEGTKAKTKIDSNFIARLSLEDRIVDMLMSIILVSVFIGLTIMLVLRAYIHEREKAKELYDRLDEMSRKDELTGLYNRRYFFHYLDEHNIRGSENCYTAMFDIDHFKNVNDVYGHLFGDTVLRDVARCLKELCREDTIELSCRYGGEEFVALLQGNDPEEIINRLEEFRLKVSRLRWQEHPELAVTISGGVVQCKGFQHARDMLSQADKYLYEAKEGGRNRIVC